MLVYYALRWTRIVLQPVAIILFWIGAWNLFDQHVLPEYAFYNGFFVWRDLTFVVLGLAGLLSVKAIWGRYKFEDEKDKFGLPKFGWKPRVWRYLRLITTMIFGALFWCGAWNFFDAVWDATVLREMLYVTLTIPFLFVLEVVMRSSSLRHLLKIKDHS